MTRQPKAFGYLIELASTGNASRDRAVTHTLEPLRLLPGVAARLDRLG